MYNYNNDPHGVSKISSINGVHVDLARMAWQKCSATAAELAEGLIRCGWRLEKVRFGCWVLRLRVAISTWQTGNYRKCNKHAKRTYVF